jgi:hypothetical protein
MKKEVLIWAAGIIFLVIFSIMVFADTIDYSPTSPESQTRRPANMDLNGKISLPGDFKLSQFIDPSVCSGCHPEIYEQWKGGMHYNALKDPVFQKVSKLFLTQVENDKEKEEALSCVRCHAPVAHVTGELPTTEGDYSTVSELGSKGVFCDFCHSVKASAGIGNAPYILEPGQGEGNPGIKWGPFKDSQSPFHGTEFSELHTRSEFCGMCHDVTHAGNDLPIEKTYTEWRGSPYNTLDPNTVVNCQDCHMRQKPGIPATGSTERPDNPGKACVMGPERKHIFTHYMVGGNGVVPYLLGDTLHTILTKERLKNAAALEILTPDTLSAGGSGEVKIKVTNTGAGHYLPTGLTEIRQMWLEIRVSDEAGNTVYTSGTLDEKGDLVAETRIFNTVLGDSKGNQTINVAKGASVITDHRIPPKGNVIERFAFTVPKTNSLNIIAILNYRSASQSLINSLFGKDAPAMPITNMAQVSGKISIK